MDHLLRFLGYWDFGKIVLGGGMSNVEGVGVEGEGPRQKPLVIRWGDITWLWSFTINPNTFYIGHTSTQN
jgi:hypothetical protein